MNVEQLWAVISGRLRVVLAGLGGVLVLTVLALSITPTTYTAFTSLNFDFKGSNPYARAEGGGGEGGYLATQLEIMMSQNLAERVYQRLQDEEIERLAEAFNAEITIIDEALGYVVGLFSSSDDSSAGAASDKPKTVRQANRWVMRALPDHLDAKPVTGSHVVTLSFVSTDPYMAAVLANAYAAAYVDVNLEMIINPAEQTKAWFDDRLKMLRAKVEEVQSSLTKSQQERQIVATDDRFDIENKRLMDMTGELSAVQEKYRTLLTRQEQAQKFLASGTSLETLPEVQTNGVVQNIRGEIRGLEGKLAELSAKLGENHPQYQRTKLEIEAAKGKLNREIRAVVDGFTNELRGAQDRVASIESALQQQKSLVLSLKDKRGDVDVLNKELESAQAAYNTALQQYNAASLQSLVNQANVYILDPAFVPKRASGPKYVQSLVLGIVVGLMLGVGLAFLFELLDRRVRSKEDLIVELKLPVLGVLERA